MQTLEEQLQQTKNRANNIKRKIRERDRKERLAEKKLNQRRNFIVGELVCKHFPQLLELTPGTKQKNAETFKDFELFMEYLSSDNELCKMVYEEAHKSKLVSESAEIDDISVPVQE